MTEENINQAKEWYQQEIECQIPVGVPFKSTQMNAIHFLHSKLEDETQEFFIQAAYDSLYIPFYLLKDFNEAELKVAKSLGIYFDFESETGFIIHTDQ